MKLDPKTFKVDENRSNPMVVAMQTPDCPIGEICFYLVVGFGSVTEECKHFKPDGDDAECQHQESVAGT